MNSVCLPALAEQDAPASVLERFPVARYRLHGIVEQDLTLPGFSGSMLRGAFGHALKRGVCVTGLGDCKSCALYRNCSYPAIFETPPPLNCRRNYSQIAGPYVVEPSGVATGRLVRGSPFEFDLVLIGPALRELPLIAIAWRRALERDLCDGHGGVLLGSIHSEDGVMVLRPGDDSPKPHSRHVLVPPAPMGLDRLDVVFETPLALRRDGKDLDAATIKPRDFLMSLIRRISDLATMQLGVELPIDYASLSRQATDIGGTSEFRQKRWSRYSSRQRRSMPMTGLIGRWQLTGDLMSFWPFLYLGQWLHVGKKCSFGFGGYRLVGAHQTGECSRYLERSHD
jgi:hypothetical protein